MPRQMILPAVTFTINVLEMKCRCMGECVNDYGVHVCVRKVCTDMCSKFCIYFRKCLLFSFEVNKQKYTLGHSVDSEYKRLKYLKEKRLYIEPSDFVLGQCDTSRRINNEFQIIPGNVTGQYISIRETLQALLKIPNFLRTILDFMQYLQNDTQVISNFIQAELFKNKIKPLYQGRVVFPILIYFDEYEVNNPLGSHAGIQKLGAVYFSLLCMPPEYLSKIENIFLTLLFRDQDRHEFGNEKAFAPLLQELKMLEKSPVFVTNEGLEIYICLALVIGDNLGVHKILGFVENFVANFSCRICKVSKEELRIMCNENPSILRTKENYEEDLKQNNLSLTGIKENCIFNVLQTYHAVENLTCDIMHDLYEGVCQYVVGKLLQFYTSNSYFKLKKLNSRLGSFDYGLKAGENRPPFLRKEKLKKGLLGFSASETLSLTMNLGILIGDLIPKEDKHWEIYKSLCRVLSIVHKRFYIEKDFSDLEREPAKLNRLFLELLGENLKFKFHILLHYSRISRNVGSLRYISCLRYESKHKISKEDAQQSASRVNIAKTIAISHQLNFSQRLFNNVGLSTSVLLSARSSQPELESNPTLQPFKSFFKNKKFYNWVEMRGMRYTPNSILTTTMHSNLPMFAKIKYVAVDDKENISFFCKILKTIEFSKHFNAFLVDDQTDKWDIFVYSDLENVFTSTMMYAYNKKKYIIFKE